MYKRQGYDFVAYLNFSGHTAFQRGQIDVELLNNYGARIDSDNPIPMVKHILTIAKHEPVNEGKTELLKLPFEQLYPASTYKCSAVIPDQVYDAFEAKYRTARDERDERLEEIYQIIDADPC